MSYWSQTITENELFPVSIERGAFIDETRGNRKVPYKIYTPQHEAGPFPVIIWSHGLGGSRDGAGFISRFVCSYGYVVVHIQHQGTDSGLWEGKLGHPWDVIRNTHIPRAATLQRLKDVPFVLDQLHASPSPQMDLSRIGMSGHSFGAMTTQVMAGQKRGHGKYLYDLFDERIKAGIVYSPVTVQNKYGHAPEDFYGSLRVPLFFMTGTEDGSPLVTDYTYKNRLEVFEHSNGPEQHLLVLNNGDHMVYNGSRGQLAENPKRDVHEKIIKFSSLAFWDAYLKDDRAAKQWLTGESFKQWLDAEATYEFREANK